MEIDKISYRFALIFGSILTFICAIMVNWPEIANTGRIVSNNFYISVFLFFPIFVIFSYILISWYRKDRNLT